MPHRWSEQLCAIAVRAGAEILRIYDGPIAPEKMLSFYHKYLEPARVVERGGSWKFVEAVPREPGDPSRTVDMLVIKQTENRSSVVVFDRMGREKVEPQSTKTIEELYEAAHKGTGSVREPIPGTY